MSKVTVGLCLKNVGGTIAETLESLGNQDFPHDEIEILIVLGISKDNTTKLVSELISNLNIKSKILYDHGKGLGIARQTIIDNAGSEFIIWVDGDIVLSKSFISSQLDYMIRNLKVGMAIGDHEHVELEKKILTNTISQYMSLLRVIHLGATICRTNALKAVDGFDQRINGAGEDTDIVLRLILSGWELATNKKAKFFHKQKETCRDLLLRGKWYGFGGHFMNRKYQGLINIPFRLPLIYFFFGVKLSFKGYKKYVKKKAFLIPMISSIFSIGWFIGFIMAHIYGYGNSIIDPEINYTLTLSACKKIQKVMSTS